MPKRNADRAGEGGSGTAPGADGKRNAKSKRGENGKPGASGKRGAAQGAAAGAGSAPSGRSIGAVLKKLGEIYPHHPLNVAPRQPFQVLVATVLSSRTKDPTTNAAMERLWARADTPAGMLAVPEDELSELIKPVGFYRNKAAQLIKLSQLLLDKHAGEVPATREELMELPGVGRKVANLVLNICFNAVAICVDTHVHRISNRLGWVLTDSPEETEYALMEIVPERYWSTLNRALVNHGQRVCNPISPRCSACKIVKHCQQAGVIKTR